MKPPALWIPSAEIERAGRVVPFGGGKAAGGREKEVNVVLRLMLEKKPKTVPLRSEKSLMMVLLLVAEHEEPAGEEFVARLGVEVWVYYREGVNSWVALEWAYNAAQSTPAWTGLQTFGRGVGVFGVDLACGGVDEEGGFIPVAEMVRGVVFLAVCASHVGDGGLQIARGIPPYLGAASDEVGGFVDAEGWETEFCHG